MKSKIKTEKIWIIIFFIGLVTGIFIGWLIFSNHYYGDCVGYHIAKYGDNCIDVIKGMCR